MPGKARFGISDPSVAHIRESNILKHMEIDDCRSNHDSLAIPIDRLSQEALATSRFVFSWANI